jgi:hypothetical protein
MDERHERSVQSAALTIMGYIQEIRSMAAADDTFHSSVNCKPTPDEAKEIESILSDMEMTIKDYWSDSGFQQDQKNARWHIFIIAQFMENLVYDIRPEHLCRTHGDIRSKEQAKKLEELCDRLDEQVRRLKEISSQ